MNTRLIRAGSGSRRAVSLAMAAACAVTLASCQTELLSNQDQEHANDIVATLRRAGIVADRVTGKNGITVYVEQSSFALAWEVLQDNGLPRKDRVTIMDIFKGDGLVSSPMKEKAQMIFAMSQDLTTTLEKIDGVLTARVHLVLPENDPLRQQLVPSSAAVFLRHRANVALNELVPQVKQLVANSISGLSYDKVSVILVPVAERVAAREPQPPETTATGHLRDVSLAGWTLFSVVALAVVTLFALRVGGVRRGVGAVFGTLRRRMRSYPVKPAETVKAR
jgi:type III secretion protein J